MTDLRNTVTRAFLGPEATPRPQPSVHPFLVGIASVGVAVGLFTVSWDRLANLTITGYNVKITAVAFSIAAVAGLPLFRRAALVQRSALVRAASLIMLAILLVLIVSSALSEHPAAGFAQVVAVLTGAIAPAVALVAIIRSVDDLRWALRWFIVGAAVTCVFGIYQLIAFYSGLPQFVDYTGLSVDGSTGRIAAFSYEPAYFGNFVLLAAGASAALALLGGRRLGWLPVIGFSIVLVLANIRALIFLIPVLCVLLAFRWRQNRSLLLRVVVVGVVVVALNAGATAVVTQIATSRAAAAGPIVSSRTTAGAKPPVSADSVTSPPSPPAADASSNVLNPNEQSSNAPRLALYSAVIRAVGGHPVLGVGPGNLRWALEDVGYVAPNQGTQVVANNVWLQAYADGGIVLVLLELGLAAVVVVVFFRRSLTVVQPLAATWFAVLTVSGMLTSYFFDVKMWVAIGLLLGAATVLRESAVRIERTPAAL